MQRAQVGQFGMAKAFEAPGLRRLSRIREFIQKPSVNVQVGTGNSFLLQTNHNPTIAKEKGEFYLHTVLGR